MVDPNIYNGATVDGETGIEDIRLVGATVNRDVGLLIELCLTIEAVPIHLHRETISPVVARAANALVGDAATNDVGSE